MSHRSFVAVVAALLVSAGGARTALAGEGVVVIGNANVTHVDAPTLQKIYTGRLIEVDGVPITAVNARSGSDVRVRFLRAYLHQDEDRYTAYWTVRRYSGMGASPRELASSVDVVNFVRTTPGAIGYVDEADVPPGVRVLLR